MATTTGQPDQSVQRLLPWLVAVAFFMQSLDTTILNTAVPAIARAMDVTPLNVKSVLASYTLSLAVFIPVSGWMADRFGTRRVFAAAIGLFTLGSVLCGLATSLEMLVACRVVQGMGGAMMMPVGRMTLARTFGKAELVRVMSFVAIPSLVGPMVGPVAGGLIVTYLDWRGVFYVNVPVGLLGLYFVQRYLPDYREPKSPCARHRRAGAVRRRHCAAVLRAGGVRRPLARRRARSWRCWRSQRRCWRATASAPG